MRGLAGRWARFSQRDCLVCQCIWLAALAAYFIYHVFKFRTSPGLNLSDDAKIVFEASRDVATSGATNRVFPYPPPAALLFYALSVFGPTTFMIGWLVGMCSALYGSINLSLKNFVYRQPRWQLAFVATVFLADSQIEYDLRNRNNNLILLCVIVVAMAVVRKRSYLAAVLVALATTLKLYSGVMLLWFVAFRPKAALLAGTVLVVLWVVLPVAVFGPQGAYRAYMAWAHQLGALSDPALLDGIRRGAIDAPVVSLRLVESEWLVRAVWSGWAVLICAACWLLVRNPSMQSERAIWPVLLLAPLPFSPWLEIYHQVAIIPAYAFVIWNGVEARIPRGAVVPTVFLLVLAQIPHAVRVPHVWRGFGFVWEAAILVVCVVAISFASARDREPEQMAALE